MRFLVVAVGAGQPHWVDEAFAEYAKRMPREARLELIELRAEPRRSAKPVAALLAAEQAFRRRFTRSLVAFLIGLGGGLLLSGLLLMVLRQVVAVG